MQDADFDEFDHEVVMDQIDELIESLCDLKADFNAENAKSMLMELHWTQNLIAGALYSNGKMFECTCDEPHEED